MPILIDLIMMGLLTGTIMHSIHLSKSLSAFKKLHGEILPMMHEHAKNITQNISQIEQMKKISTEIAHVVNSHVPKALTIKQDLEFLVSRANDLADYLERAIERDRQKEFGPPRQSKSSTASFLSTTLSKNNASVGGQILEKSTEKVKPKSNTKKPFTESFSLTKTAKKLFAKTIQKDDTKRNLGEDHHAA